MRAACAMAGQPVSTLYVWLLFWTGCSSYPPEAILRRPALLIDAAAIWRYGRRGPPLADSYPSALLGSYAMDLDRSGRACQRLGGRAPWCRRPFEMGVPQRGVRRAGRVPPVSWSPVG